jgi:uncharacterized membrane protein YjjB (DUF3815 family)
MWTLDLLIQMITALLGTVAFAVMFRLPVRFLHIATVGGGITYFVYYVISFHFTSLFAAAFFSTALSALYSEFCARRFRAPAIVFSLLCAIPIVPGGSLYRTMVNLISEDYLNAWFYFQQTVTITIGIAGGLALISLTFHIVNSAIARVSAKKG